MTTADLMWLLQIILGGFGIVLWSMFRDLKRDVKSGEDEDEKLRRELLDYKLHVAEKYVTSISLEKSLDAVLRSIEAVFVKLDKIDEKLDSKVDKKRHADEAHIQ